MIARPHAVLAAAFAAVCLSIAGCGSGNAPHRTLAEVTPDLTGADPRLVALYSQSNEILGGGKPAFQARMKELRGLPIVVNIWGSWCAPCVAEAPALEQSAKQLGNRVAFIGVNIEDRAEDVKKFQARYPQAYPSYDDPDREIASSLIAVKAQPFTNIYDASGRLVHTEGGPYKSAAALDADIERYAGPLKADPGN
ncbi:MAG: TlpA disulfide reductase family protein [Solirubrobacterales bacterium]